MANWPVVIVLDCKYTKFISISQCRYNIFFFILTVESIVRNCSPILLSRVAYGEKSFKSLQIEQISRSRSKKGVTSASRAPARNNDRETPNNLTLPTPSTDYQRVRPNQSDT